MLSYKQFIIESSISNNTKGRLHELLVGYHLNGGKHMEKHVDKKGNGAEIVHERLKSSIPHHEYEKIYNKAKLAADDIKKKIPKGHDIHEVHWTSQPGDIQRSTGLHSTQKEDSSDIVLHTRAHPSHKPTFTGVSLKVSEKSRKKLPSSSLGTAYSGSRAKDLHDEHKNNILNSHPELKGKNAAQRKLILSSNPEMKKAIHAKNSDLLKTVAKHHSEELQSKLDSGNRHEVVSHIKQLLHAHETTLEKNGHNFIRHTTYETKKSGVQHNTETPSKDHDHILKDPKNITIKHSGNQTIFYHKGKKFASQSHKFDSQSDPLSSLKSAGRN
jgi:hypothetical protein